MNSVTLVTALYNIQRETKGDGRKWEEYLEWFKDTLALPFPMVIFVDSMEVELNTMIQEIRQNLPTQVYHDPIPYQYYEIQFQEILNRPSYRQRIQHPNRVECKLPMYNIIQYSKFPWLVKTIERNPFQTPYFFWIDAGISRFLSKESFGRLKKEIVLPIGKCVIQHNHLLEHYPVSENYLWDSQCLMCGTMFGGEAKILIALANQIDQELMNRVPEGWINNEQILLAYLYHHGWKDRFHLVWNTSHRHLMLFDHLFVH